MKLAGMLLLLAVGCGQAQPELKLRGIGFLNDLGPPLLFALNVENVGGGVCHVDKVEAIVLDSDTVVGPPHVGKLSDKIEVGVALYDSTEPDAQLLPQLSDGESIDIPAGERVNLCCGMAWWLPDSPPPALGLVSVEIVASYRGKTVLRVPPYSVVLQTQPDVFERVLAAPRETRQAAEVARRMGSMPRKSSHEFKALREFMAREQ